MEKFWLPLLIACALAAALLWLCRRSIWGRRTAYDPADEEIPADFGPAASNPTAAERWLEKRSTKLATAFDRLIAARTKAEQAKIWTAEDELRFNLVRRNMADYLVAMGEQLDASFFAYRQLFNEGPFTTVAINSSGWSLAWGVWMVDAHIEMLTLHTEVRLELLQPQLEHREWKERHLQELEKCLNKAGFLKENPFLPQYAIVNAVRKATSNVLVNFDETPFGCNVDEALRLVRVSATLPQADEYFKVRRGEPLDADAIKAQMDAFIGDRAAAWRPLTADEIAAVKKELERT